MNARAVASWAGDGAPAVSDCGPKELRFELVFRTYYSSIEHTVRRRFPDADLSDVMSATFMLAWARFEEVPDDVLGWWLSAVAGNFARNSQRGAQRRRDRYRALEVASGRSSNWPSEAAEQAEDVEATLAAIRRLRRPDRRVLWLAAVQGLKGDQLGEALGITGGAASVQLHRARRRLTQVLGSGV